jgi:SNF2 family DNA or RNA helicase
MASPDSANGNDNFEIGTQTLALNPQSNHQGSSFASEEATMMLALIDAPEQNLAREPSRPKSEVPQRDIRSIPEEPGVDKLVHQNDESAASDLMGLGRVGMADMAPNGSNSVLPEASNIDLPSAVNPSPIEPRTIVLTKKLFKTPKEREVLNAEDERRLQEAKDNYQLSLINKLPPPDTSASPVDPRNDDHAEDAQLSRQSSPIPLDTDAEDASAAARYTSLKRSYERKKKRGETSVEDDVAFSKARNEHDRQTKLKSKKRAYEKIDSEYEDDDPLFLTERSLPASVDFGEPEEDSEVAPAPKRRGGRPNKIPESALRDATQIGLAALEADGPKSASRKRQPKAPGKNKAPKDPKPRTSKSKDKQKTNRAPKPKEGRKRKGPEMLNIQTLFNNDIVSAAQANVGKAAQPGFTSTNKRAALAELIASIPEAERTTHNADKNALDKATRSFTGHAAMKADGNNGWRLRGMATSLYHYQLLGAAFMRDRENSNTRPYGGLQSDEMGLGKTVTCLANIIDGQAPSNSPNRTTLIVCPAGLCSQWLGEIRKHVLPTTFQDTIVYRAGAGLDWADPIKSLSKMDIIITSYGEVLRSFPYSDPPMHLSTSAAKATWWTDHFTANRGALHKIFFRRIVLDEGGSDSLFCFGWLKGC